MKFFEWLKGLAQKEGVQLEDLPATFSEADIKAATEKAVKEATERATSEFAEAQKKKDDEMAEREKKLKNQEAEARKKGISNFCEDLKKKGILIPAMEKLGMGITEFMQQISGIETTVEFGEGDKKAKQTPLEFIQIFLQNLPKAIEFKEVAGGDKNIKASGDFEALVADYCEKNKVTRAKAIGMIAREHPDLHSEVDRGSEYEEGREITMLNEGIMTFTANGALAAKTRVKITSASTTTPIQVETAGVGEQHIGVTEYAAADGAPVAVRLRTYPGSHECVAADTFAVGAVLYGAALGKISDSSSGTAIGIALEACTGAGDIVEFIDFTVISTAAANVSIADAGAFTAQTTVEAALQEIYQDLLTAQGSILLPLGSVTMEDGTALTKQATTVAGYSQLSNLETVINIPINCTSGENLGFSVPVPLDLDDTEDITIHVLAGKAADLDALTLDCEVFPSAAGDVGNADIQDTAAQTITQAVSELTYTCGADGVLEAPGTLSVVLILGGTNDGDAVYIYGAWIEYTKKILTS